MASLLLRWSQSADDPSLGGDVASYEIARGPGPNPVSVVASVPATPAAGDTAHTDFTLPGTYFYRVRAVDGAGNRSPWSNEVSITVTAGDVRRMVVAFAGAGEVVIAYAEAYGWKIEWRIAIPQGEDPDRPAGATAAEFLLRTVKGKKIRLPAELDKRDDTWFATHVVGQGSLEAGFYSVQFGLHFGSEVYDLTDPSVLAVK